jgi:hypothetical protein
VPWSTFFFAYLLVLERVDIKKGTIAILRQSLMFSATVCAISFCSVEDEAGEDYHRRVGDDVSCFVHQIVITGFGSRFGFQKAVTKVR